MTVCNGCRGMPGGEENGQRGYMLTYVIAYIRVRMSPTCLHCRICNNDDVVDRTTCLFSLS